jgi:hypothetical protein
MQDEFIQQTAGLAERVRSQAYPQPSGRRGRVFGSTALGTGILFSNFVKAQQVDRAGVRRIDRHVMTGQILPEGDHFIEEASSAMTSTS